jgi:hypothetical protein
METKLYVENKNTLKNPLNFCTMFALFKDVRDCKIWFLRFDGKYCIFTRVHKKPP